MGLTIVRDWWWRAILTCTTCHEVVLVGPASPRGPHWACYILGFKDDAIGTSLRHLGKCAGGALDVSIESLPPSNVPPLLTPAAA